jgi:predicted transcriptional regulator
MTTKTKQKTISFRMDEQKSSQLDTVAEYLGKDRTYVLNQAVDTALDIYAWQIKHIEEGLQELADGKIVPEKKWRESLKGKF